MKDYLVLLDDHAEGPLDRNFRWGSEGEIAWKLVQADSEGQAIQRAFEHDYTLSSKREADEAQRGDTDFPWHAAVAIALDDLPRPTMLRMVRKTVYELELKET